MMIDRESLTAPDALKAAKILDAGRPLPEELLAFSRQANEVLAGVRAGWFLLPKGRNAKYTKSQFGIFHRLLAAHPDIAPAKAAASSFMDELPRLWPSPQFELFGRPSSNRIANPLDEARSVASRCPRMPLTFEAGQIGPEELCDVLDDVSNNCRHLINVVSVLKADGMLSPDGDLREKASLLRSEGLISLLPAIIHSVHRIYMGRDGERSIRDVMYRNKPIAKFVEEIAAREEKNRIEAEASWKQNFKRVADVAAVLAEVRSYHQATLTRELRRHLGQRYGVARVSRSSADRLVVLTDSYMCLGESSDNRTEFELVNWVISLDCHLKNAEPSFHGYLKAAEAADASIVRMRQDAAA